jgi:hypothetical protein
VRHRRFRLQTGFMSQSSTLQQQQSIQLAPTGSGRETSFVDRNDNSLDSALVILFFPM